MGVMYAIEVARTLLADPATAHLAVDVGAWADEEGTYGTCLGSRSFVGDLDDDDLRPRTQRESRFVRHSLGTGSPMSNRPASIGPATSLTLRPTSSKVPTSRTPA